MRVWGTAPSSTAAPTLLLGLCIVVLSCSPDRGRPILQLSCSAPLFSGHLQIQRFLEGLS